jgi:hypothetical protein
MTVQTSRRFVVVGAVTLATFASLPVLATGVAAERPDGPGPSLLPSTTVVAAPPAGAKGPDDLTRLAVDGLAGGRSLLWTAFQNGIGPDGTPALGGPSDSTIAGYDPKNAGSPVRIIHVTGKVDGLTADPGRDRLIATVNEDKNSGLDVIDPATGTVTPYHYVPDPAVLGNGGTDSVAVKGGRIFVVHSNPNDAAQAAEYELTLDKDTSEALLRPVFFCDSVAKDAVTGVSAALGLGDPDTSAFMPRSAPRFGGQLATVGQGDGQIVFASHLGEDSTPKLTVLNLSDNTQATPQVDGLATATSDRGTLYVVDNKTGTIKALDTKGWPEGTVFVGSPNGLGTLDLSTGKITALSNAFGSPKGLLFVPASDD